MRVTSVFLLVNVGRERTNSINILAEPAPDRKAIGFNPYDVDLVIQVSNVRVLTFLAARAEMRRSLCHQHAANGRLAMDARLAGALVHAMAELEKSLPAFGIDVIGNGRSTGGDRFREHRHHGVEQSPGPLAPQPRSDGERMNARAKKGLVGVDIAHASHEALVEQQRLDAR